MMAFDQDYRRFHAWRSRKTWMLGTDPRIKSGDEHDEKGVGRAWRVALPIVFCRGDIRYGFLAPLALELDFRAKTQKWCSTSPAWPSKADSMTSKLAAARSRR